MARKRILRMSVVTTVIACGVLYGQRVSAAPAGEAAATLSQLGEPAQVSADGRRITFGGDGPGHPADFNGDGAIGAADLAVLLGSWGECPDCPADIDGNGMVGASDLAVLLDDWGQFEYNLEIGPVAGLTTAWHHSPDQSAIPLGSTVQFRVVLGRAQRRPGSVPSRCIETNTNRWPPVSSTRSARQSCRPRSCCCGTNFVTRHVNGRGDETLHEYDEFGNRLHT